MYHYINEAIKFGCNIFVELIGVVLLIIGIIGLIASEADYVFLVIPGLMLIACGVFNLIKYDEGI